MIYVAVFRSSQFSGTASPR